MSVVTEETMKEFMGDTKDEDPISNDWKDKEY